MIFPLISSKAVKRLLIVCRTLVWAPTERGTAIVGYAFAVVGGPVLGPIVGGAVTQSYLRWRCKSSVNQSGTCHAHKRPLSITSVFPPCSNFILPHRMTVPNVLFLPFRESLKRHLLVLFVSICQLSCLGQTAFYRRRRCYSWRSAHQMPGFCHHSCDPDL